MFVCLCLCTHPWAHAEALWRECLGLRVASIFRMPHLSRGRWDLSSGSQDCVASTLECWAVCPACILGSASFQMPWPLAGSCRELTSLWTHGARRITRSLNRSRRHTPPAIGGPRGMRYLLLLRGQLTLMACGEPYFLYLWPRRLIPLIFFTLAVPPLTAVQGICL